jgi:hypothetical protein
MKRFILPTALLAALAVLAAACGGGDSGDSKTQAPTSTAAGTKTTAASATPAHKATAADFTSLRSVMEETKAKAEAGDVQGTRDAEGKGDDAIEAIINSLKAVNPTLANKLETLELDYEGQADSDKTDLTVMAKDAQDVLDLLEEAATALNITAGTAASSADLSTDLATLKSVMEETKAKADAGELQATRDAEGKGDDAIEAIIKAVREKDGTLADKIETLELDYEGQADSDNTDLAVMSKDAQAVLDLLDQVATTLNITS